MGSVLSFLLSQLSSAFTVMDDFEVFDGVSLLDFFVVLLVVSIVLSIVWVGKDKGGKSD